MNKPYYPIYNALNIPVISIPNINNNNNIPIIPNMNPNENNSINDNSSITESTSISHNDNNNIFVTNIPNSNKDNLVNFNNTDNMSVIPNENNSTSTDDNNISIIPVSNLNDGGPVAPNPNFIITTFPRPNIPCYYCNTDYTTNIRFLNTSNGYEPFLIYINNKLVINGLGFSEISQYGKISSGSQTITIAAPNGYTYIQKSIDFDADKMYTIAIISTQTGLGLEQIIDSSCDTSNITSGIRVCNLSYNNSCINISLNNGFVAFKDIKYKEVTPFKKTIPSIYYFNIINSNKDEIEDGSEVLVSFNINIENNSIYTIYVFNWGSSSDSIRTMIIKDYK